tara:strand:+ start:152 stop:703 length:552 start_codon:yes stop_codon:yes gene_type:complete
MDYHQSEKINGIEVINLDVHEDKRGYLFESFKKIDFLKNVNFCQDNVVKSRYSCLRGLHYQIEPLAQSKLITVIKGEIQDVALDIRKSSKTFGKYFSIILSENSQRQLFIPKGFAHGFLTLSEYSIVHYKVDNFYSIDHQSSIAFNDENIGIDWRLREHEIFTSIKDSNSPKFIDVKYFNGIL